MECKRSQPGSGPSFRFHSLLNMNKSFIYLSSLWLLLGSVWAAPGTITEFIRIDQFGYLPSAPKVAIISQPMVGFNAPSTYQPGTTFELRNWDDDQVQLTLSPQLWNNGNTHALSGDKGWWIDFSSFQTPGSYYLYDLTNDLGSYRFEIGEQVYNEVLKTAVRTFFYQRLSQDKQPPYVPAKWSDGPAFDGPDQDRGARSRYAKSDPSTARDLHGGWMDAGDVNKYTTFAEFVVVAMLQAYRSNPAVFGDDYNIPESGNGIPDILDEVRFELEWLERMQDASGNGGLLMKLGVDNYNGTSPPSADTRARYYVPECTSSTLAGAGMFAIAGLVYRDIGGWESWGNNMIDRAEDAWERAETSTNNFTSFEEDCDDGNITSGDADRDALAQRLSAVVAAIYLYDATDKAIYRTFVEANYNQVRPMSENWWGPYNVEAQKALLEFSEMAGVSPAVATAIRNSKAGMNYQYSIDDYQNGTDLYRAFLEEWAHHWGSSQIRADAGNANLDFVEHEINSTDAALYTETAATYLQYLHGANPLGRVMLSNMYEYGGDFCVNEFYHNWFDDGTDWDNVNSSLYGPAPGFLVGGPNYYFSNATISPPANQPPQKSYKDWNAGWPENSWEITENAIYYQARYIKLLSRLMPASAFATSISDPAAASIGFSLFPNPARQTLLVSNLPSGNWHLRLVDLQGKIVWQQQENKQGTANLELELPILSTGLYLMRIEGVEGAGVERVWIE